MFEGKTSVKEADSPEMVFLPRANCRIQIAYCNNYEYSNSGSQLEIPSNGH